MFPLKWVPPPSVAFLGLVTASRLLSLGHSPLATPPHTPWWDLPKKSSELGYQEGWALPSRGACSALGPRDSSDDSDKDQTDGQREGMETLGKLPSPPS